MFLVSSDVKPRISPFSLISDESDFDLASSKFSFLRKIMKITIATIMRTTKTAATTPPIRAPLLLFGVDKYYIIISPSEETLHFVFKFAYQILKKFNYGISISRLQSNFILGSHSRILMHNSHTLYLLHEKEQSNGTCTYDILHNFINEFQRSKIFMWDSIKSCQVFRFS